MIVHRVVLHCFIICLVSLIFLQTAQAHGGVVDEGDLCVIKVNYLRAHFKIYQPRVTGHEQFCEDLPVASESVFVMEYLHDSLSTMPIEFRIIRDVTGKGRFARLEDVENIDDIESATVFYQPPILEPDVYTVIHEFVEEGDFIGIVSARNLETGKVYAAVFPFEVGFTGWGYWPLFVGLLVLLQIQYLTMRGRLRRWFSKSSTTMAAVAICLLLLPPATFAADFVVTYSTPSGKPQINRMHSWILHIENESGAVVEGAIIDVTGGMPEHNHGLPTKPRITQELGGGDYKLEGMRFHMSGYWEIVVNITTETGKSTVIIALRI